MAFKLQPHQIAVYGTLKRGCANHALLRGARYVGTDRLQSIALYDLGHYPGAKLERSQGIEVEIYAVTPRGLNLLDRLEEHIPRAPERSVYDRKQLETCHGPAWVYLYRRPVKGHRRIVRGGW
ncbi:gamma-glutamylcyclotransferase family protein [Marinobacter fonticola]|uniref:gamma-glutamylcyclotransferase family protein n=1 Tax=Marinobacter fonticola TaxID=2603215 RepID=UPI0011E80962|nr:gamma-glutamylcyclotransferase family protein [Marinobacter fonticola]